MQKLKVVMYFCVGIVGGVLVFGGYLEVFLFLVVLIMCGVVVGMIFFVVNLLYKDRKFNLFEKKINYVGKC